MDGERGPGGRATPTPDRRSLQLIGDFARAVGLSPAALRQYGATGLIPPAAVQEQSGYRFYAADQQQRAIWVRRLRDAGLRLDRVRAVLESEPEVAFLVLDEWLAGANQKTRAIAELVDDLKHSLKASSKASTSRSSSRTVDASMVAAAIGQVIGGRNDEARSDTAEVLVEFVRGGVSFAYTDGFVLLARLNVPGLGDGPRLRACIPAGAAIGWLQRRRDVELLIEQPVGRDLGIRRTSVTFRDRDGQELSLVGLADHYPDVGRVVDSASDGPSRAFFSRDSLMALATARATEEVHLVSGNRAGRIIAGQLVAHGSSTGTHAALELSRFALARIVRAAVGEDLVCDFVDETRPVVWRAPSQPDFVGMQMPRSA